MNLEENSIVSNKPQDDDSLELSDSTVMAERASITADNTSTSALGDEPTYDEQVREDIEAGDSSQVTDPCVGLKGLFKATATMASMRPGPFREFYLGLLAKGMKPAMARLTLALKIAAITLILWKKGESFDAEELQQQAA